MDEKTIKYLGYLESLYTVGDSFLVASRLSGKYHLLLPCEIDSLITDNDELDDFVKWVSERLTSECVKDGVIDFYAFKKMCVEHRALKQVSMPQDYLNIKEVRDLLRELILFKTGKKRVNLKGVVGLIDMTEEEMKIKVEDLNEFIVGINNKYNINLDLIEYVYIKK